jgi:hypothetical protein
MQTQIVSQIVHCNKILEEYRNSLRRLEGPIDYLEFRKSNLEEIAPIFLEQYKLKNKNEILGKCEEATLSFMEDLITVFGLSDVPEIFFDAVGILFSTPVENSRFFRYEENQEFARKIGNYSLTRGKSAYEA